ncbi:hypothetical protein GCM10022223_29970 [Kineosporia mesophila]|uniref:AMP-dependent synthetase/ligase domain-containing protein n=1 Tax=Kineosporia mesophila TaxID=566012 RepID=A0ABP6ZKQ6_9ACTN|nr:AMP-binding protein [Kineosporia mesophila]
MEHDSTFPQPAGIDQVVPGLVGHWVQRRPQALAVRDPLTGENLSYSELWWRAGRLAGALAERGVGRGDVVAVAQKRSVSMVVSFLGVLRAGAAYLPLDAMAPADRIAGILQDAGTDLVVLDAGAGLAWPQLPSDLRSITVPDLGPDQDPDQGLERGGDQDWAPGLRGDDPAYVAFTSGSTGRPKGVVVPHRAVRRLATEALFCTVGPGDRVGNAANPAFDATTFEIWNPLVAGGSVVVLPDVADLPLDDWIALTRTERLSALFLTTSLFHTVARERPSAFSGLDTLVIGGEQLELGAVRRVLAADPPGRLVNGYGPTETTTFAAYFDCTNQNLADLERIPIGFPLQNTSLVILDEQLSPVPAGDFGELCVGGPGVALGYLGRPELTAEKFVHRPGTGELIDRTGARGRDGIHDPVPGRRALRHPAAVRGRAGGPGGQDQPSSGRGRSAR